jgi:uncharacterized protein with von Willebrand factor type A (vWA) domain
MKALSKDELEQRAALIERWKEKLAAVEEQRAKVDEMIDDLNRMVDEANEVIDDARRWAEDIARVIDEYIDERSEKWQESERGEAYAQWRAEYENLQTEDMDHFALEENPQPDLETDLENLPEEPEA